MTIISMLKLMKESKSVNGISPRAFLRFKLYQYPIEEQADVVNKALDGKDYKYIKAVSSKYDVPYSKARKRMAFVREKYGVSFRDFKKFNMYGFNNVRISHWVNMRKKAMENAQNIIAEAGYSLDFAEARIDAIEKATGKSLTLVDLVDYSMLDKTEAEAIHSAEKLIHLQKLVKQLKKDLHCPDAEEQFQQIKELVMELLPETKKEKFLEHIEKNPEVYNPDKLNEIYSDIHACYLVLNISAMEYMNFHFAELSLQERTSYLSNNRKNFILRGLSKGEEAKKYTDFCSLVDNKYECYQEFCDEYGREAILIKSDEDFDSFKDFCKRNKSFIKKPLTASQGSGIEIFHLQEDSDLMAVFASIRNCKRAILEALVVQSPLTAAFNPDSLNTFRFITFHDGLHAEIKWGFFRTGRIGSVVDNAGAGGVFAAIDPLKGIVCTDGTTEAGCSFVTHPDSGLAYKGFAIPDWDSIKTRCCELADGHPEAAIIGWDFAYTDKGEWLIVELNCMPEFVFQGATRVGVKKEFDELVSRRKANTQKSSN